MEVWTMLNIIEKKELVDIRDVSVDKALPKHERVAEFIRQIKDPYHFKCGKFTVRARFSDSGVTMEECLQCLVEIERNTMEAIA
jgi:CRISPR/Cas system-associated protein Cas5 (RAMP superfamily)